MDRPMNGVLFRVMALEFAIRDRLHPPERRLREAHLRPGETVLDYGCGPGGFTIAAARMVGPEGLVYAADIHPLALRMVDRRAAKAGLANVRSVRVEKGLPLSDASVDVALLYNAIHDFADPDGALREIRRVLRPGGRLSIHDFRWKRDGIIARVPGDGRFRLVAEGKETLTFA